MRPELFNYTSPAEYLEDLILFIKAQNPLFSKRSMANKLKISSAVFSSYLRGKTKLSIENAHRIAPSLGFTEQEKEYFFLLIEYENLSDPSLRKNVYKKIVARCQSSWPDTQSEVLSLFESLTPVKEFKYAYGKNSRFRVLTLYKEAASGRSVRHFVDRFFAADWKVGGAGYFIENPDGTFRSYLERGMNRDPRLELTCPENLSLKVSFDQNGLPTVENLTFTFLHLDQYMVGSLSFSPEKMITEGLIVDLEGRLMDVPRYFCDYERIE